MSRKLIETIAAEYSRFKALGEGAFAQVTTSIVSLRLAPAAAVGSYLRIVAAQGAGSTFAYQVWVTTYFSATAHLWH